MSKKKRATIISSILVFVIVALFLCTTSPSTADVILSLGAQRHILKNGLNVILKKDATTPTAAVTLLINTGSATEGKYSGSGITHLIEHMMFKGTATYTAIQLANELKALGAEINAYTSLDHTYFTIKSPAISLERVLHIFNDMISNPIFDDKEFEKEKQVILREIDMGEDNPDKHINKIFWQTAYTQHPYRNPVIGFRDVFEQTTLADVKEYFNKFYIPNNMVLTIVGDIVPAQILFYTKETLGKLKRKRFSYGAVAAEPHQLSARNFSEEFEVSRPKIIIGFHTVGINNPDLYALDTLSIILGGGLSSRLYKKIHDEKDLVHSIGSYNYTPKNPGIFIISALIKEGMVNETLKAIKDEIEEIKQSHPKDNELKKAMVNVLSSYLFGLETQEQKADNLAVGFSMTGDLDFAGKYVKGVEAVTAEDVFRVAKKYLTEENMTTVMLLPRAKPAELKPFQEKEALEIKTTKKVLKNGLTVLITEHKNLPICSVVMTVKGGLRSENKANNGISNFMVNTMVKGTKRFNKDQIVEMIESYGASLSPYSGNNSLGLTMNFLSRDTAKMMDIFASIITDPVFSEKELELVRKDIAAGIALIKDDIFKSTNLSLRNNLFQNHPYRFIATGRLESVNSITRDMLKEHHSKLCVGKNAVLSICGNVDTEDVFKIIEENFRILKAGEPFKIDEIELKAIKKPVRINEKMDKRQAVVMIGYRSAGIYDESRYPLQILSSLFSGGAGRLYENIRQKEGLAYTLGTFGMTGLDVGAFVFYAATVPQNVERVREGILTQVQQVFAGKITSEEINAAKKSLITKHQLSLQDNGGLALQMALDELYGLGYENYKKYHELINSISRKKIITTARKYLKLNKNVTVVTASEHSTKKNKKR